MLKWSGDFTLPRLRAKLANKYLLHPDVEPGYAEIYRPDLSQTSVVRKDSQEYVATLRDTGGLGATASFSGTRTGAIGSLSGSFSALGASSGASTLGGMNRTVVLGGTGTMSATWQSSSRDQPLRRVASVPALGGRRAERAPATLRPLPSDFAAAAAGQPQKPQVARAPPRTVAPSVPTSPTADERREAEKEKQIEWASARFWTASGGCEMSIKECVVEQLAEDPRPTHQAKMRWLKNAHAQGRMRGMKNAMKQGAKVDWPNPEWDGATLLLKAVRMDAFELFLYLLALDADPAATDRAGRGVLHWAAIEGNARITSYFLDNIPDLQVNAPDEGGDSPLHLAAYSGHLPVVRLLIRAGAEPLELNGGGFTAQELAEARRMWDVAGYLTEFRQHEEDRAKRNDVELRSLVRTCNLHRANEVLAELAANPKPKGK